MSELPSIAEGGTRPCHDQLVRCTCPDGAPKNGMLNAKITKTIINDPEISAQSADEGAVVIGNTPELSRSRLPSASGNGKICEDGKYCGHDRRMMDQFYGRID